MLSLFDFSVLLLLLLLSLQGFRNGIVYEVLTITGLIAALFIAFRHMDDLALFLSGYVNTGDELLQLISATLLFSVIFVTALLVATAIGHLLKAIRLNMINRIFGLIFGAFKMALILSAILLLFAEWGIPSEQTRQASYLYPYILRVAPWAFSIIAPFYPGAEQFLDQMDEVIQGAILSGLTD